MAFCFYKDVQCKATISNFCSVFESLRQQKVNPQLKLVLQRLLIMSRTYDIKISYSY